MNTIGVDVGTSSVRVSITRFVDTKFSTVELITSHVKDITVYQDDTDKNKIRFEQSSSEIWAAICESVKICLKNGRVRGEDIESIGFSATCSLVVWNDVIGSNDRDVIMWMDHRAIDEANFITINDKDVCNRQFGGACSPEFSLAKVLWLKSNEPDRFARAKGFFELPDWLAYRCVGGPAGEFPRSLCSLVSKWGYNSIQKKHCRTLQELINTSNAGDKIGYTYLSPGMKCGFMSLDAAAELGLIDPSDVNNNGYGQKNSHTSDVTVVTSLIDAHAGMLAMLSIQNNHRDKTSPITGCLESTLCSLAGTSSCHMLLSPMHKSYQGIWGPYEDVILKDYYLLEAGQSFAGKLIERTIENHPDGNMRLANGEKMYEIIEHLNEQVINSSAINYRPKLHVLPFHHGNRSPLANPRLMGGIYGLSSSCSVTLTEIYAATVEALVFEFKLIIEKLDKRPETILVSGGLMKNNYYMQTLANVLHSRAVRLSINSRASGPTFSQYLTQTPLQLKPINKIDLMNLGSCLLAKHALRTPEEALTKDNMICYQFPGLESTEFIPQDDIIDHYNKRYRCFRCLVECSQQIDLICSS